MHSGASGEAPMTRVVAPHEPHAPILNRTRPEVRVPVALEASGGPAADILLVENNEGDIFLAQEALKDSALEIRLHVVRDGVDARAFLRREGPHAAAPRPKMILLDLNMPRLSGREVLQQIKQDPELMTIPVVVLSTSSTAEDVRLSYELHANCYITKPPELSAYLDMVKDIERFWLSQVDLP